MLRDITLALLAGGKSTRFGSDKLFAKYGEQTFIERALEIAAMISENVIVIGNVSLPGYYVFKDVFTDRGPLGAVHSALLNSGTDYIATLPVDMPKMNPAVYNLLDEYRNDKEPVVAVSHTGLEPLVCIWPKKALSLIENKLMNNLNSPIVVLNQMNARRISVPAGMTDYNPDYFLNINHVDDLK